MDTCILIKKWKILSADVNLENLFYVSQNITIINNIPTYNYEVSTFNVTYIYSKTLKWNCSRTKPILLNGMMVLLYYAYNKNFTPSYPESDFHERKISLLMFPVRPWNQASAHTWCSKSSPRLKYKRSSFSKLYERLKKSDVRFK